MCGDSILTGTTMIHIGWIVTFNILIIYTMSESNCSYLLVLISRRGDRSCPIGTPHIPWWSQSGQLLLIWLSYYQPWLHLCVDVDSAALVLITSHYWPHLHHKYVDYRAVFTPASFPIYLLLLCLITHLALWLNKFFIVRVHFNRAFSDHCKTSRGFIGSSNKTLCRCGTT